MGVEQISYFRIPGFSRITFENEKLILDFLNAPKESHAVFITDSSTASVEAVVMGLLTFGIRR